MRFRGTIEPVMHRRDARKKEPKCGQGGINPPNLKRPLPFDSEVSLTDIVIWKNIMIGKDFLIVMKLGDRIVYLNFEGFGFGWGFLSFLI